MTKNGCFRRCLWDNDDDDDNTEDILSGPFYSNDANITLLPLSCELTKMLWVGLNWIVESIDW